MVGLKKQIGGRKHLPYLFFLCLPLCAQEVTVRVTPKNPVVGDEVRLELEILAPRGVRVEMPDNPGVIDCAEVLDREPTEHGVSFLLDPIAPGSCHIPALAVRYGNAVIASQPIVFQIGSLVPPGDPSPDIRDGQTPLPLPEPGVNWMVIAVGALVVVAVVAWFTFGGRQPATKTVALEPAEVRARRRLARLAGQPAPVPREFYSELSHILTAYLDERLAIRSTRCTSPELLAAVQRTDSLTPTGRDLLEALLEDCDCAKFSSACALGDNSQEAVACCRKIIDILCGQAASRPRLMNAGRELTRA
jgi:hypothetical protein